MGLIPKVNIEQSPDGDLFDTHYFDELTVFLHSLPTPKS